MSNCEKEAYVVLITRINLIHPEKTPKYFVVQCTSSTPNLGNMFDCEACLANEAYFVIVCEGFDLFTAFLFY